jgi:phage terminase large subunit-like protein
LVLCAFYKLLVPHSVQGNQCYVIANDEEQAGDDLALAKKLVQHNPVLQAELKVERKRIVRKDGRGALEILPARDSAGAHGKTAIFVGFDEVHAYRGAPQGLCAKQR